MSAAEQTGAKRPSMLVAALFYARRGIAVFPLKPRLKRPLGRLAPHGVHDAVTSEQTVRGWWSNTSDANIGVACGEPGGVFVVDIDGEAAELAIAALEREHGALPACWVSTTGKGRHLWFRHDERIRNTVDRQNLIDTRSTGGYVVAPPSAHPNGTHYAWVDGRQPTGEPVECPEWFIDWLLSLKNRKRADEAAMPAAPAPRREELRTGEDHPHRKWCLRALEAEAYDVAGLGHGAGRNNALNTAAYKLAGYMPSGFLDEHEIVGALMDAATRCNLLAEDGRAACLATIRSGINAGRSKPRELPELRARPAPLHAVRRAPSAELTDPGGGDVPPPTDEDLLGGGGGGRGRDELPAIFDGIDEYSMVADADRYLARDAELYQRGGILVHVLRDRSPGAGKSRTAMTSNISPISEAYLRALSTREIRWMKRKFEKGAWLEVPIKPPGQCIKAVHQRKWWDHIRFLNGVTETPIFKPSGTILSKPGYDVETGVLFEPTIGFPRVPSTPSGLDVEGSIEQLRNVIRDFPFVDKSHEAAWFAALLTPLARHTFTGNSPLFLIDSNTPGTGKGKLASIAAIISTGRQPAVIAKVTDDAEIQKRITSVVISGAPVASFDNIDNRFGTGVVCSAFTNEEWSDRVLGENLEFRAPMLVTWFATGNNTQLTTDMVRRTVHIRLETNLARPETRDDFAIPNLEQYVREHRGRLAAAALTILRAWHVAGRPKPKLVPVGSFDNWSDAVRAPLVWAGLADPGLTQRSLREVSDSSSDAAVALIEAFASVLTPMTHYTAGEILVKSRGDSGEPLRTALEAFNGGRSLSAQAIARTLGKLRGRVIDGRVLRGEHDPHRKQLVWGLERQGAKPDDIPPELQF